MFSAHETGIIITFPPSCAMSALTLCILNISSGILCPGAALLLVSTKKSTATGGENAFLARSRNFLCTAHARQGGKERLADEGVRIFVTFAQSITFESIIL